MVVVIMIIIEMNNTVLIQILY